MFHLRMVTSNFKSYTVCINLNQREERNALKKWAYFKKKYTVYMKDDNVASLGYNLTVSIKHLSHLVLVTTFQIILLYVAINGK